MTVTPHTLLFFSMIKRYSRYEKSTGVNTNELILIDIRVKRRVHVIFQLNKYEAPSTESCRKSHHFDIVKRVNVSMIFALFSIEGSYLCIENT